MLPKLAANAAPVQISAPRWSRRPQRIEIRVATGEAQAILNEKKYSLQNPSGRAAVVALASLPIPQTIHPLRRTRTLGIYVPNGAISECVGPRPSGGNGGGRGG